MFTEYLFTPIAFATATKTSLFCVSLSAFCSVYCFIRIFTYSLSHSMMFYPVTMPLDDDDDVCILADAIIEMSSLSHNVLVVKKKKERKTKRKQVFRRLLLRSDSLRPSDSLSLHKYKKRLNANLTAKSRETEAFFIREC